jgi:DNA polymerase-3 subunit alpha
MDTRGIFQFESDGMMYLLKNINVDRFEDLIVANALYRPGPLGAKVHDMYCDYKHGRKEIKYLHPKMGEALEETYGIMVFQENIMKIAQVLAGFTGGQADTLRKAVGKKKPELLKQQRELFVGGCAKNGVDKGIANKIFEQIDFFAGYGFNKSHSAAYAFLAYQTAYLKLYYPIEFMCSLLTSEIDNNDKNVKLNSYIAEGKRMGVICKNPTINESGLEFKIEKGLNNKKEEFEYLRVPFTIVKGVGAKAVDNIVENQPFRDFDEFIMKIDGRRVNKRVVEALINSGCMQQTWRMTTEQLLSEYKETKERVDKEKKKIKKQEEKMAEYSGSLFDEFDFSGNDIKV